MSTTLRTTVGLAGWVSCISLLAGLCLVPMAGATFAEQGREQAGEQAKDRYEHSRVLVEAFVAEVKLESLYKLGVSPIGQKPNAVSIKNIVECLKSEAGAKVTAGTKVAVRHNEQGSIQESETKYIQRERQVMRGGQEVVTEKVFDDYNAGMTFTVNARAVSEGKIAVEYNFNQSDFVLSNKEMPPDRVNRQWNGRVFLEAGKPSIVGATQDEDRAAFLILTADIDSE